MHRSKFRALLADGGLKLDNLPGLQQLTADWFKEEPSVGTFIISAIFESLHNSWCGEDAIPSDIFDAYRDILLEELLQVADIADTGDNAAFQSAAAKLVPAYHACQLIAQRKPPPSPSDN